MNDADAEDEDEIEEAEALLVKLRDGLKTGNQPGMDQRVPQERQP